MCILKLLKAEQRAEKKIFLLWGVYSTYLVRVLVLEIAQHFKIVSL